VRRRRNDPGAPDGIRARYNSRVPMRIQGLFAALLAALPVTAFGAAAPTLRFASVFGDGAVLQQEISVPVWGWAQPGAKVIVRYAGQEKKAVAGGDGRWLVTLDPITGGAGELVATAGKERAVSRDVAGGEVWLCSGQSNMAMNVGGSDGGQEAAKTGEDAYLRVYRMPDAVSDKPQADAAAKWVSATPESIPGFSAIGYWFARSIRQLNAPVGLIVAAWGGTAAETWADAKSLAIEPACQPILTGWKERVRKDPELGMAELPFRLEIDRIDLLPADGSARVPLDRFSGPALPGRWEDPWAPGVSTAKFEITSSEGRRGLFSGTIGTASYATVVRTLGEGEKGADLSRFAAIRLKVRGRGLFKLHFRQPTVWDWAWHETPAFRAGEDWQELAFTLTETKQPDWGAQKPIELATINGLVVTATSSVVYPEMPSGLYNGEIAPVARYAIRGALWYQGEANAGRAWQYRSLLPAMIRGWRKAWRQGDFHFFIVQLPGWQVPADAPVDSDWAELREAQAVAAAAVPNADYACTIDLGDAADIHPKRKREVAERLALIASMRVYGRAAECSGPRYAGMEAEVGAVRIRFSRLGGGLEVRGGGELTGFGVAGEDRKFVKAAARVEGDTVVVSSPAVPSPVAVRYAWSQNPVCNLRGKIGLPVAPFRTDDWPLTTLDNK